MNDELLNLLPEDYEGLDAEPLGVSPLSNCDGGLYADGCGSGSKYGSCSSGPCYTG